jgi:hypothetical protein
MKMRILAGAAVLVLAAGMSTSAMASNHKASRSGSHVARVHAAGTHGWTRHGSRFASERGWEDGNAYGSGYKSLGPLGITFGCVHGYCGQGYSVSAWSR